MTQGNANGHDGKTGVAGLEADAAKMMSELDGLMSKIRDLGNAKPGEVKEAAAAALKEQMRALQDKLGTLAKDHEETLAKIDKSVRANPYLYIVGALGLGVLLGKATRS